jgi:hypothetical protein
MSGALMRPPLRLALELVLELVLQCLEARRVRVLFSFSSFLAYKAIPTLSSFLA